MTHECAIDTWSLSGVSLQSFEMGSSNAQIYFGNTQSNTACAYTYNYYYWNNSTAAWTDITSGTSYWYVSQTNSNSGSGGSITIGVSSANYASFQPEVYYLIKGTWTSTYSEATDATVEEEFWIRFYDDCYSNSLTA